MPNILLLPKMFLQLCWRSVAPDLVLRPGLAGGILISSHSPFFQVVFMNFEDGCGIFSRTFLFTKKSFPKMRAIGGRSGWPGRGLVVLRSAAPACPCPAITQGHQPRRLISGPPRSPAQLPPPTGGAPPQMRRLRSTDARLSCSRPLLLLLGLL